MCFRIPFKLCPNSLNWVQLRVDFRQKGWNVSLLDKEVFNRGLLILIISIALRVDLICSAVIPENRHVSPSAPDAFPSGIPRLSFMD